jgi:hypothetical protein
VNNNKKNILAWVVMTAVVFMLIYYIENVPRNSYNNSYGSVNFIVRNEGVNFSQGIANAPKAPRTQEYQDPDLGLPTYTPQPKTYTVSSSSGISKSTVQTNYSVIERKSDLAVSTKNSNGDGTGVSFAFIGSRNRNTQNSAIPQTVGFTTLSTDLSSSNKDIVTNPQLCETPPSSPLTDPGGDPNGRAIPVGDGWGFLMLCAIAYGIIKNKLYSVKKNYLHN